MKKIPLSKGLFALIDDGDFEIIKEYSWSAALNRSGSYYALKSERNGNKKTTTLMHRLLLKPGPGKVVDHINHNTLDNRRSNMRICSPTENLFNRRKQKGSTSKYKGVSWHCSRKRWQTRIQIDGKTKTIGFFKEETVAALAYNKVATIQYGEYAFINKLIGSPNLLKRT